MHTPSRDAAPERLFAAGQSSSHRRTIAMRLPRKFLAPTEGSPWTGVISRRTWHRQCGAHVAAIEHAGKTRTVAGTRRGIYTLSRIDAPHHTPLMVADWIVPSIKPRVREPCQSSPQEGAYVGSCTGPDVRARLAWSQR